MDPIIVPALLIGVFSGAAYLIGYKHGYKYGKRQWRYVGKIEGRYRERWGKWADEDPDISSTHYTAKEMDTDVLIHKPKDATK